MKYIKRQDNYWNEPKHGSIIQKMKLDHKAQERVRKRSTNYERIFYQYSKVLTYQWVYWTKSEPTMLPVKSEDTGLESSNVALHKLDQLPTTVTLPNIRDVVSLKLGYQKTDSAMTGPD